jgi:alkylated DNA nucleotide flippase Atl1
MKPYCEMLALAPASSVHVLEPEKARRLKGATMVIPSPQDVARAINAIPWGETRTFAELRQQLAHEGNAEIACPAITNKYWKWIAAATEDCAAPCFGYAAPWCRVLKDGKLSTSLPVAEGTQAAKLLAEGVTV